MKTLPDRLRVILERRAGLPESRCRDYYALCASRGYDLKGIEGYDPSLLTRAMNFTGAVIQHVASGAVKATEAEVARRVSICAANACGLFEPTKRVCRSTKCGCFVDTKATWQEQACPLDLWETPTMQPTSRHPMAKAVTKWAVGMTTAPRSKPTIFRCLASVHAAGFRPTIFAEPGSIVTGLDAPVILRTERLGCWRNYVQTLRDLLRLNPTAEAIMIWQDDVVACRDLREFLEHDLWPSITTGVVSVYSPEEYESGEAVGIDKRRRMVLGVCAAIYPRAVAERLVSPEFASDWRGCHNPKGHVAEPHLKKAADAWVADCLARMKLGVYHYRPSLVQHLDAPSSIGHGGASQKRPRTGKYFRQSTAFVGEETSAFDTWQDSNHWCRWTLPAGIQRYRQHADPLPQRPITVVIPGYGCPDLTRECLAHLERSTVRPAVIYVDDGSTADEWAEVLAHPTTLNIRHMRNEGSKGFTGACNTGIAAANPGSHVLLLNNDTRIGPHCIERLRWHAELHRDVGAVGPITGDDGQQSLKHAIHAKNAKPKGDFATWRYTAEAEQHLNRQLVIDQPILSGFCLFLNREALDQLGPLSTAAHLAAGLGADDEWCQRATQAGRINLLVYNAWCAHLHKTTFKRQGIDRAALQRAAVQGMRGGI